MIRGIDISNYQAGINYDAVAAGAGFAILKVCEYREDASFRTHYDNLKARGIPVGGYIYTHAKTAAAVQSEIDRALGILADRPLDLPLFLDMEDADINTSWKASVMPVALAFGKILTEKGIKWGIYANRSWWQYKLDVSTIREAGGCVWCAAYNNNGAGVECDIWQYSDAGQLDGVSGKLDMNSAYDSFLNTWSNAQSTIGQVNSSTKTPTDIDAEPSSYIMGTVKFGDKTPEAKYVRALLESKGYDVDWMGMDACIIDFQQKSGLQVDGIVGEQTWRKLIG